MDAVSSKKVNSVESSGVCPPHHLSFRENLAPDETSKLSSFQAPVPFGFASRVVPVANAVGVISDWALNTDTRYGKLPLAPARVNVTVFGSVATTEPVVMTPLRPALPAAISRSIVATTSAAVNGVPSCQVTPFRRLNVQTVLSAFGVHFSARPGAMSVAFAFRVHRNSKDWAATPYDARSCIPIG